MSVEASAVTVSWKGRLGQLVSRYGTLAVLVLVMAFFGWQTEGHFLDFGNMVNVLEQSAILAIISFGMAFTLIGGGIDMSVAAVAGLCATVFAALHDAGQPLPLAILATLLVGVFWGAMNGLIIVWVRIKPFVATLCTMFLATGVKMIVNQGLPIWTTSPTLDYISRGSIATIPVPVIILLVIVIILYMVANNTRYGIHLYSRGGNPEGARASGVNVNRVAWLSYLISGITAAITGVMLASRLSGTPVEVGEQLIVDVFTAALISTTVFGDGLTNILGTLVGALFVSVVENGSTLMGLGHLYVDGVKGILMLTAGAIGFSRQRQRGEITQLIF